MHFPHLLFGILVLVCQVFASAIPGLDNIPLVGRQFDEVAACETQCANWTALSTKCFSPEELTCGCTSDHAADYEGCAECQLALPGGDPAYVTALRDIFEAHYTAYAGLCKQWYDVTIPEVKIDIPAGTGI
ncbi:hypothetical protein DFP72DRAFT_867850, partial [Ephemerocybe angulata]